MKNLVAMTLCLLMAVSCGQSRSFELDTVYPGTFFSFRHPSKWAVTPADSQVSLDFEGNSIAFKFSPLEKSKNNDISSIQELAENYKNTVLTKGEVTNDTTLKLGNMECVWVESKSGSLCSVAFFMPVDGGVYSGTAENIGDSDIFEAAKAIFNTFEPKSVPVIKNTDPREDFITHNGVIYSISFPKSWTVSGDTPMLINGKTKHLEIDVKTDKSISPANPSGAKIGDSVECSIGQLKAFMFWSQDKSAATYYIPMHGKVMSIKAVGYTNGSDPELEKCIGSFRYFEDKDVADMPDKPKEEPKTASNDPKPVNQVKIPHPENVEQIKGETYEKESFRIVVPNGWTVEEKPASVFDFYPPNKESGAYFEVIVQSYTKSAKEVAQDMIDAFAPGTELASVDIAGTKAAQFTYKLDGFPATVTTVITKGKYLYQIIYNQDNLGKADLKNEYASFLKSFEPK